jgi:anti-sigma factor RsiW
MNNDPLYQRFRELSWRRKLTGAEEQELQTWLAAHPEAQADWETEAGLNEALRQLPNVPVPSNFTARVLQAVEREEAAARPRSGASPQGWLARWFPRMGFAALLLSLGVGSYRVGELARTNQLATSIQTVAEVSPAPNPDLLKDFDAIRALPSTPAPDVELLALLQ